MLNNADTKEKEKLKFKAENENAWIGAPGYRLSISSFGIHPTMSKGGLRKRKCQYWMYWRS
jgi:hypothetical protein